MQCSSLIWCTQCTALLPTEMATATHGNLQYCQYKKSCLRFLVTRRLDSVGHHRFWSGGVIVQSGQWRLADSALTDQIRPEQCNTNAKPLEYSAVLPIAAAALDHSRFVLYHCFSVWNSFNLELFQWNTWSVLPSRGPALFRPSVHSTRVDRTISDSLEIFKLCTGASMCAGHSPQ